MKERSLKLIHFKYENNIKSVREIESRLCCVDGIDSVEVLKEDKMIYISFDSEVIAVDSIIELLKEFQVEIIK
ncbi:MAG: hypothetical protein ACQESP_04250 [Candidatus Muiribacteriota bacterium]